MRSVMAHSFSQVPRADIPRSTFNRSHGHKTTWDADYLIPILVDDILPGDTLRLNMTHFTRLATPLYPIMDNIYVETFFFFVPYRILWDNWEKFHGAQDNPGDSIDFTIPNVFSGTSVDMTDGALHKELLLYMGIPYNSNVDLSEVNSLPMRAYNKIWNDWFRDQNLQNSALEETDNGPDNYSSSNYPLRKRGKRFDYFTSGLPWPQKGDAVDLPLGTRATVATDVANATTDVTVYSTVGVDWVNFNSGGSTLRANTTGSLSQTNELYADLSGATAATINELRLAFQTQRLLERDARSGTRYNEMILAHFGVTVPDYRVQRPEFLGGGSDIVNVTPVATTTQSPASGVGNSVAKEQGDLGAVGTASGTHGFTKSFTEHGVLLGLINARADITYSQGLDKYWFKSTRYDWYYPVLAQIGEQTILNKEIYYQNTSADEQVFAYQERYAEYRYKQSRLSGLFSVDRTTNLAPWHLSEDFAALPTLGDTFIQSNTGDPLDRAIAIPTEPHFISDIFFDMRHTRPMPLFGVPGNLDHF